MPDLSRDAIQRWFYDNGSAAIGGEIGAPGHDEHPDVLPSVLRLGGAFDTALAADPGAMTTMLTGDDPADRLAKILAHMGGGRRMRLLHWMHDAAGSQARVVNSLLSGEPGSAGAALRLWVLRLHRRDLLDRLFAEDRLATLLAACRSTSTEQPA